MGVPAASTSALLSSSTVSTTLWSSTRSAKSSWSTSSTCASLDLEKLLADRKITIDLTPAARKAIFKSRLRPRLRGARPLKRAIQRLVQDPLATKILDGTVRHNDHVVVDAGKQGLTFNVNEPAHSGR